MSNVTLNAGAGGATLGTDQVAGTPNVDYQIVKIGYSVAGSAPTQVSASNALPVIQTGALPVGSNVIGGVTQSGTWNITNISGTITLPTGAATAAKQPALGTAGTPSADVISVQGVSGGTAIPTSTVDTTASGSITSTQSVTINTSGQASVGIQVSGSFTGTLIVEGTIDGSTWNPTTAVQLSNGTIFTNTTGPTAAQANTAGLSGLRVRGNTVTVGTATVSLRACTTGPASVMLDNPLPTGTNVIGALSANQSVNTSQINGVTPLMGNGVTGTGSQRVTIASDNTAFSVNAIQSGSWSLAANQSVNVAQINGVTPLMGNGVTGTGSQRVTIASDNTAFTVNAAQSGTWTVQPGNTPNSTAWLVQDVAGTAGGMSFNGFVGAASNNKTQIKGSAGTLYLISVQNLAATPVYLKVFDKTSANVTAGTTACDYQFMIPGNTAGAGIVLDSTKGIAHANGITIMLTAGIATNDNTAVSANNQVVMIGSK